MTKQILHLTLKKKWFDMILSGEKKEEYRDIKPFWNKMISHHIKIKGKYYHPTDVVICFSHVYTANRNQFMIECKGLAVREGKESWGAEPGKQYYVLILGEILS